MTTIIDQRKKQDRKLEAEYTTENLSLSPTIREEISPPTTTPVEHRQNPNTRQIFRGRPIQQMHYAERYHQPPTYNNNRQHPPQDLDFIQRSRRKQQQILNQWPVKYAYLPPPGVRPAPSYEPAPLEPQYMASFNSEFKVPTQITGATGATYVISSALDPYAMLAVLGFLVFLFYIIYNFLNTTGNKRSLSSSISESLPAWINSYLHSDSDSSNKADSLISSGSLTNADVLTNLVHASIYKISLIDLG